MKRKTARPAVQTVAALLCATLLASCGGAGASSPAPSESTEIAAQSAVSSEAAPAGDAAAAEGADAAYERLLAYTAEMAAKDPKAYEYAQNGVTTHTVYTSGDTIYIVESASDSDLYAVLRYQGQDYTKFFDGSEGDVDAASLIDLLKIDAVLPAADASPYVQYGADVTETDSELRLALSEEGRAEMIAQQAADAQSRLDAYTPDASATDEMNEASKQILQYNVDYALASTMDRNETAVLLKDGAPVGLETVVEMTAPTPDPNGGFEIGTETEQQSMTTTYTLLSMTDEEINAVIDKAVADMT